MMERAEIERRAAQFERWHYEFNLDGYKTPIWDPCHVNRHEQRKQYFFDPLVSYFGGTFAGKRILDLGCNAGFWAVKAIECGCDFVLSVDARQSNIDQAGFVFEALGIDRDRFELRVANIFDIDLAGYGSFDIVLNLGLLYHVNRPVELLEFSASVNSDVLLIDTAISIRPGSFLELRYETTDKPINSVESSMVMYPTARAVLEMTRLLGYRSVILRPGLSDTMGCWDYQHAKRRAFLCAKKSAFNPDVFKTEDIDHLEAMQRS